MEKILVSACLLGQKCRYDGKDSERDYFRQLNEHFDLVPFCPEMVGGLSCPRPRSEIKGSQVVTEDGKMVTREFEKGAQKALEVCSFLGITKAILKEDSPSCGTHFIHDGFFRNKKIQGMGFTAAYLKEHGIEVMNEEEGEAFLQNYVQFVSSKPVYKEETKPEPEKRKSFRDGKRDLDRAKIHASREKNGPFHEKGNKPYGKKPFGKKFQGRRFDKKSK